MSEKRETKRDEITDKGGEERQRFILFGFLCPSLKQENKLFHLWNEKNSFILFISFFFPAFCFMIYIFFNSLSFFFSFIPSIYIQRNLFTLFTFVLLSSFLLFLSQCFDCCVLRPSSGSYRAW